MITKDTIFISPTVGELSVPEMISEIEEFVNDVCRCEKIYSSSLHGIVCANAYGIPVERIKLGDKMIGGDFKFNDYQSVKPDIEELWVLLLKFLKMDNSQEVK